MIRLFEQFGLKALSCLDSEQAHRVTIQALRSGLIPLPGPQASDRLATDLAGLTLPNPVGLAAGFDKNAEALRALSRAGFGFIEVGAVTPRPQPGNPRPRLFRLAEDRGVINRFGFNNAGMAAAAERLARHRRTIPVGLNLGANKDSADRVRDFGQVLRACGPHLDFATVNVSSPNTERLRDLQGAEALRRILRDVMAVRDDLPRPIPIFLKIAPDLNDQEISDIAGVALELGLDALIATNTTLDRDGLSSRHRDEKGGLSGAPLFEKSTRVLAQLSAATEGRIPLVGVGGIGSAEDAYAKIGAGATAVQLYSAMVYQGISLIPEIIEGLDRLLARDGHANVAEAIGRDRDRWL